METANLELLFRDGNVYLNYWECGKTREINCQVKGSKIHQFVHNTSENEELERSDLDYNPFEQREISLEKLIQKIKQRMNE